jgi:hypothetical protein
MRLAIALCFLTAATSLNLYSQTAQMRTAKLWTGLQARREALAGLHREFRNQPNFENRECHLGFALSITQVEPA